MPLQRAVGWGDRLLPLRNLPRCLVLVSATPPQVRGSGQTGAKVVPLLAIRAEVDGLTFAEILALSRAKDVQWKVGFLTEPSAQQPARP